MRRKSWIISKVQNLPMLRRIADDIFVMQACLLGRNNLIGWEKTFMNSTINVTKMLITFSSYAFIITYLPSYSAD